MSLKRAKYDQESFAAGASASLNKSLKDIDRILEGLPLATDRPLREEFRSTIRHSLVKAQKRFYKIGFKRGVFTAHELFKKSKNIPFPIKKKIKVSFLASNRQELVTLLALKKK
jgi:hypothetical protein